MFGTARENLRTIIWNCRELRNKVDLHEVEEIACRLYKLVGGELEPEKKEPYWSEEIENFK